MNLRVMGQAVLSESGVEQAASGPSLRAIVPTPAMAERVDLILDRAGIPHRWQESLLNLDLKSEDQSWDMVAFLWANLSEDERQAISVTGGLYHDGSVLPLSVTWELGQTRWFDQALLTDGFVFYYQPIVSLVSGLTVAHECLIRLEGDRIYNGEQIIRAATLRDAMRDFDHYARAKAIRMAARQRRRGRKLFVNLFPSSAGDAGAFLAESEAVLAVAGLSASDVVFELVECDTTMSVARLKNLAQDFREHGFQFALDDLGTGTNTLDAVYELRPDYIKLDKSIVWNLADPERARLARRTVEIADQFGLEVIAEGIESVEMAARVRELGVRMVQGYYFGRPAPQMREPASANFTSDLVHLSDAVKSS